MEPTPLRNGALCHRLRPVGQTVLKEISIVGHVIQDFRSKACVNVFLWIAVVRVNQKIRHDVRIVVMLNEATERRSLYAWGCDARNGASAVRRNWS